MDYHFASEKPRLQEAPSLSRSREESQQGRSQSPLRTERARGGAESELKGPTSNVNRGLSGALALGKPPALGACLPHCLPRGRVRALACLRVTE